MKAKSQDELTDEEALRVDADDIGDDAPLALERGLQAAFLTELLHHGPAPHWTPTDRGAIALRLSREAGSLRVRGTGEFTLSHECVRCLRPIGFDLAVELDLVMQKGDALGPDGEVAAGQGDAYWEQESTELLTDADVIPFDGETVDVGELLREQIFLDVPTHPTCELPGARPQDGPCELDPSGVLQAERDRWVDPRFQALADLRDSLPPGPDGEN